MRIMTSEDFVGERTPVECLIPSFSRDPEKPLKVLVRPIEIREVHELRNACGGYPQPPMKADDTKGSDAPKVPDASDTEYVKKEREWNRYFSMGKIAFAINYQPKGFSSFAEAQSQAAWVKAAADELGKLSDIDVDRLLKAINIVSGADVDAKKF